jgi:hypothetical protein
MLITENLGENRKIKREIQSQSLQKLLPKQNNGKVTQDDLINCEASIIFLEEMIRWLETMLESKKKTRSQHLGEVEKKLNNLNFDFLEISRKELEEVIHVWGRRPFEDNIHEKGVYT